MSDVAYSPPATTDVENYQAGLGPVSQSDFSRWRKIRNRPDISERRNDG
jgi:hypothetical protein